MCTGIPWISGRACWQPLVEHGLGLDPFAPAVFVFGNRQRDRVKILGWERNGFWRLAKRLDSERFVWPRAERALVTLTVEQLHWLLAGVDLAALEVTEPAHAN